HGRRLLQPRAQDRGAAVRGAGRGRRAVRRTREGDPRAASLTPTARSTAETAESAETTTNTTEGHEEAAVRARLASPAVMMTETAGATRRPLPSAGARFAGRPHVGLRGLCALSG